METKEKFMQKTIVVWLGALVCCLLWGSAFPCIKIGYQMMHIASDEVASQILYAGYRFTLAGILTILLGSIGSRRFLRPTKGSIGKVFKLSSLHRSVKCIRGNSGSKSFIPSGKIIGAENSRLYHWICRRGTGKYGKQRI